MSKTITQTLINRLWLVSFLLLTNLTLAADQGDFTGVWEAYAAERGDSSAMTSEGQQILENFRTQYGDNYVEPGSYCVPPGLLGIMTAMVSYPIEVIHSENRITILTEFDMQVRRIFVDGRDIPENYPTTGMGYSVGHWDDEALMIKTSLLSEYLVGNWPLSEQMTVMERIYKTTRQEAGVEARGYVQAKDYSDDVLVFELIVDDPTFWAEPQEITMYYQKIPDDSFLEYICSGDLWRRALDGEEY